MTARSTTSTVRGADWYAREIDGEVFEKVEFIELDLTEAVTRGTTFTDCTFVDARFNCSRHEGSAFAN